jgi:ankyrin repeat protein
MPQALPANPNYDWLKKAAKRRLAELRAKEPDAKLHQAQLAIANDYGFKSWRALKAHVEAINPPLRDRERVFEAARAGDVEAVRRAFASGFDPATPDVDGRTIHQIAKDRRHSAIEVLTREVQGGRIRSGAEAEAVQGIASAAQSGDVETLRQRLDARPDLINALAGRGFPKATALHLAAIRNQHAAARLLMERGANLDAREFPDNAAPLHFAAMYADLEMIRLLVEAGADVEGKGDDSEVGVLGWASCFRQAREDVAEYLLSHGATLNLWSAIALDKVDDVRAMVARDRALLTARMTRNHHRRTPLHHAAARNRPRIVQLLLELGADPNAADATGATALATASQESADQSIVSALLGAGARLDFLAAVNMERYGEAEAMLRDDPSRIGASGRDTIALHLAVSKQNLTTIRWLLAHGVDVNAKRPMWDCNQTALHLAIESGAMEIVRLLLEAGADPNIRDDKVRATALGWADYFGREDFAVLVREKGGVK